MRQTEMKNARNVHYHQHNRVIHWHTRLHDCRRNKNSKIYDEHMGMVSEPVLHGWPSTKGEPQKDLKPYWLFKDEITIIDVTDMKGRRIIIPAALQDRALKQLHLNHMGIGRQGCWHESIHWMDMNVYTEETNLSHLPWFPGNTTQKIKQCHMICQKGHGNL